VSDENPLVSEIRQASKPRLNVNLPPRTELPDEAVSARAREIGEKWGSNTLLASKRQEEPPKPTAPLVSLRFDCPDYTDRALSVRAAEENVTKTYLLLMALKAAGYPIEDVDLAKDRRRGKSLKR